MLVVCEKAELAEMIKQAVHDVVTAVNKKKIQKNYTPKEACERIGISRSTFFRWQKDGSLKTFRKGDVVLVSEDEVQRLLLNNTR